MNFIDTYFELNGIKCGEQSTIFVWNMIINADRNVSIVLLRSYVIWIVLPNLQIPKLMRMTKSFTMIIIVELYDLRPINGFTIVAVVLRRKNGFCCVF